MALPVLRRNQEVRRGERAGNHDVEQASPSWGSPAGQWSPLAEFNELYERMGRLLAEAVGGASRPGSGWRPAADVEETAEAYVVELELPGVKREDVTVEFGGGELAVTGEVTTRERVGLLRTRTRPVGRFDYRVRLPAEVQDDEVVASLSDGVLTVRVPKTETARPRRIPISTS